MTSMSKTVVRGVPQYVVDRLNLKPLPEGYYYKIYKHDRYRVAIKRERKGWYDKRVFTAKASRYYDRKGVYRIDNPVTSIEAYQEAAAVAEEYLLESVLPFENLWRK